MRRLSYSLAVLSVALMAFAVASPVFAQQQQQEQAQNQQDSTQQNSAVGIILSVIVGILSLLTAIAQRNSSNKDKVIVDQKQVILDIIGLVQKVIKANADCKVTDEEFNDILADAHAKITRYASLYGIDVGPFLQEIDSLVREAGAQKGLEDLGKAVRTELEKLGIKPQVQ